MADYMDTQGNHCPSHGVLVSVMLFSQVIHLIYSLRRSRRALYWHHILIEQVSFPCIPTQTGFAIVNPKQEVKEGAKKKLLDFPWILQKHTPVLYQEYATWILL